MSGPVDVLAVMDAGLSELRGGHCTMWTARDVAEMRAAVAELIKAALRAECSFNTVGGCYERNPRNFMSAMRALEADVIPLRAALANVGAAK